MKRIILFSALALFLSAMGGCEKDEKIPEEAITKKAKVFYDRAIDSCGNVYMIEIVNKNNDFLEWYKPNNLPKSYQVDGINVEITYTLTGKYHNCGFGGKAKIINIHKIKKI